MKKDYFSFFGIRPAFLIDVAALKRLYYQNSRKYHPDHSGSNAGSELTDLAEFNNTAYQTLSDFYKRTDYIIKNYGNKEISSYSLDPDFLIEMMELNEHVDDFKAAEDYGSLDELKERIHIMLSDMDKDVSAYMKELDDAGNYAPVPEPIVEYYLKRKYLLRIQESLNTFADPNRRVLND